MRIVFLGKLADLAGDAELAVAAPLDWAGLLKSLEPGLAAQAAGEKVRIALNGGILTDKAALAARDGDEVALLPPVSGG